VGKLYNTIKFIRCISQRREVFKGLIKDELAQNLTGKLSPTFNFLCQNLTPRAWHVWIVANSYFSALMVISDNDTRWNSTYLSMERALALDVKIRVYSEHHKDELSEDFMTLADWDVIRELKQHLEPFWELTIDL
jgi:hypothetical protein